MKLCFLLNMCQQISYNMDFINPQFGAEQLCWNHQANLIVLTEVKAKFHGSTQGHLKGQQPLTKAGHFRNVQQILGLNLENPCFDLRVHALNLENQTHFPPFIIEIEKQLFSHQNSSLKSQKNIEK